MRDGDRDFTLIRADRLIDGSGSPPVERGAVLLEGDTIAAVGPEDVGRPAGGRPGRGAGLRRQDGHARAGRLPRPPERHGRRPGRRRADHPARRGAGAAVGPQRACAPVRRRDDRAGLRREAADDLHAAAGDRDGHHRRADAGAHRQADGDCRRPPELLRHRGDGPRRVPRGGAAAREGGRGLRQDHGYGRQHEDVDPGAAVLRRGRADGDLRRDTQVRQARGGPLRIVPGDAQLPRRGHRHDHPRAAPRAGHGDVGGSTARTWSSGMVAQGVMANCNLGGSTVAASGADSAKAETGELSPAEQAELDTAPGATRTTTSTRSSGCGPPDHRAAGQRLRLVVGHGTRWGCSTGRSRRTSTPG